MKRAITISIFDQSVLSAQSLIVGLLLIRFGDAESVGRFALSMALYFAFLTTQESLFGAIITNRVFGRSQQEQSNVIGVISSICATYFVAFVVLVAFLAFSWLDFSQTTMLAAIAMVVAGLLRELARSVAISTNAMLRCFSMDLTAAVLTLLALAVLLGRIAPEAACLFAISFGHGVAFLVWKPRLNLSLLAPKKLVAEYAPYFRLTRWNFISNFSSEVQSRTFLFLVEIIRDLFAIATLHIGRLIISPIMLIVMAVVRILQPRVSNYFHQNKFDEGIAILRKTAPLFVAMSAVYGLCIYLAWPLLDQYLFRGAYPEIASTMTMWCVYMIVSSPFWSLHIFFVASERFRELAMVKVVTSLGVVTAMTCMAFDVPLFTAVLILVFGKLASGGALLYLALNKPLKAGSLS